MRVSNATVGRALGQGIDVRMMDRNDHTVVDDVDAAVAVGMQMQISCNRSP